ncbi:MAG: four helix bundle protein [Caldilineaceae bacterium]
MGIIEDYEQWLAQVPVAIRQDQLWKFEVYRKALFLADLAWFDVEALLADPRGKGVAWQLVDSAGSVSANIEEGYARGFGKDYARFLTIALGSAKETRGWYYRGRHVYAPQLITHRIDLTNEIITGLIPAINYHRRQKE